MCVCDGEWSKESAESNLTLLILATNTSDSLARNVRVKSEVKIQNEYNDKRGSF